MDLGSASGHSRGKIHEGDLKTREALDFLERRGEGRAGQRLQPETQGELCPQAGVGKLLEGQSLLSVRDL